MGNLQEEFRTDPEGAALLDVLLRAAVPFEPREAGINNDLEQDKQIRNWPLRNITCPTLVLHGTADDNVPFTHGETAAAEIPGAKLIRFEGEDHLAFIKMRKEMDAAIAVFLAEHGDQQ